MLFPEYSSSWASVLMAKRGQPGLVRCVDTHTQQVVEHGIWLAFFNSLCMIPDSEHCQPIAPGCRVCTLFYSRQPSQKVRFTFMGIRYLEMSNSE